MSDVVTITIDGVEIKAEKGQKILDAATKAGIYIPTLCNFEGVKPKGSCRICSVLVNGRPMTACTTPVSEGMVIENDTEYLNDLRKAIVEIMFVEGNHMCPVCERSGNCELQALAYRYLMMVPRFPYLFPTRDIDASHPKLIKDHDRCILCKRCIRAIQDENGKNFFAFKRRGYKVTINIDPSISEKMTDELAQKAMDVCPVGALIRKEKGYDVPIGKRKYDKVRIGNDIENKAKKEGVV
ncbi:MAG: (2Fe-2S)-binding protein [Candidatus Cloacimonetes bacterium]|nr:(2Fe-2S)-binding protein [Candidatus Cloacimonadota bacterium]